MSKTERKEILVYADWKGLPEPALMGTLRVTPGRGKEMFSFEYTDSVDTTGLYWVQLIDDYDCVISYKY